MFASLLALIRAVRRFLAGSTETPPEVQSAVDDVHHTVDEVHERYDTFGN